MFHNITPYKLILSPRGEEIFNLILSGLTIKNISDKLKIHKNTVRINFEKILNDNSCATRIELVALYYFGNLKHRCIVNINRI